ncbi:9963_t:CDS:2 [Funneliformis geosporum]|nr:9963_t:CDS:2 [Funneliformis geosporum]
MGSAEDEGGEGVTSKLFSGKSWEQIKNKLACLWFKRLDVLFRMHENHNPGFLVNSFSNNTQLFDDAKKKELKKKLQQKLKNEVYVLIH